VHLTASEKWRLTYVEFESLQKTVDLSAESPSDIIFIDMNDKQYRVSGLKFRDEVLRRSSVIAA